MRLELGNDTLQKELEISSKTHAKTETGLDRDFEETGSDLNKKTREVDALRAKIGKLDKYLAAFGDAPNVNEIKS